MKFFSFTSGILISIASVVAACSSTDTPATGTAPDGGSSGSTGTGGKASGGSTGTGGKATGGGGGATGGSTGTGGKATGGGGGATGGSSGAGGSSGGAGGSNTGGSAGDGGPTGDGGGDPCAAYCDLEDSECGFADPVAAPAQFNDRAACMTACAQYPTTGQDGDASGDTLQCRVTHLNNIVGGQPASLHCPHTGENPTMYCQ